MALFAAAMVCGHGLHGLQGLNHSVCPQHACCGHSCGNVGRDSPHSASELSLAAVDPHRQNVHGADCAICGFIALAHGLPAATIDAGGPTTAAEYVASAYCMAVADRICAYRSRAPPAVRL